MLVELRCPRCPCRFAAPPDLPAEQVVRRMTEEGPWCTLAEGDTFEDMVLAALLRRGAIRCPECRTPFAVSEASLGRRPARREATCGAPGR